MGKQEKRKSGGARKIGRALTKCKMYLNARKHEKAHIKKIKKHLKRFTTDNQAQKSLEDYKKKFGEK